MKCFCLKHVLFPGLLLASGVWAAEIAALPELASKNDREVEVLPFRNPEPAAGEGLSGLLELFGLSDLSGSQARSGGLLQDDGDSSLTPEPGSIVILAASSIPESSLRAIAKDAARLGIPLALSGLPVKARREEAIAAAEKRGDAKGASPFEIDREKTLALSRLLNDCGASAAAAPGVWHAVRDHLDSEPAVPALVLFGTDSIEVFPGDMRPLKALFLASVRAKSPEIRSLAKERLKRRGLFEEARSLFS